jgi:hypothetical protein
VIDLGKHSDTPVRWTVNLRRSKRDARKRQECRFLTGGYTSPGQKPTTADCAGRKACGQTPTVL